MSSASSMGEVLRPIELVALPGGKGVNAARAAARLGGRVTTTGIAGGHAGRWIVEALAAEGLDPTSRPPMPSRARRTSPSMPTGDVRHRLRATRARPPRRSSTPSCACSRTSCCPAAVGPSWPAACPRGVPPEPAMPPSWRPADAPAGRSSWTPSGAGLLAPLRRPAGRRQGRPARGRRGGHRRPGRDRARGRQRAGRSSVAPPGGRDRWAARGRGRRCAHGRWRLAVPQLEVVNAVGSGDSFNAGLLAGAARRCQPLEAALARGVAAGSANALALGAGMPDPRVARELEERVDRGVIDTEAGAEWSGSGGRGVIVTGATGIAAASARRFAEEGARLVDHLAHRGAAAGTLVEDISERRRRGELRRRRPDGRPRPRRRAAAARHRAPRPRRRALQRGRRLRPARWATARCTR